MQNPYDIRSDEQGYFFITDFGVIYRIVFDDLSQLFHQCPALKGRVFSFAFYPSEKTIKSKTDERIKYTIASSIKKFFEKHDNLIVFVCDSTDYVERDYSIIGSGNLIKIFLKNMTEG